MEFQIWLFIILLSCIFLRSRLRSNCAMMFSKIRVLKNFSKFTENSPVSFYPAQVFFQLIFEIFKSTCFIEHHLTTAFKGWSVFPLVDWKHRNKILQKQPLELFYKKGVLKNSQNAQENTCARVSFLIKLKSWDLQLY